MQILFSGAVYSGMAGRKDLPPVRCDLQVKRNNSEHRTIGLSTEARLFLRRGQEFMITLQFRNQTLRQEDLSRFSLIVKTGPKPSKQDGTKNSFPISSLSDRKTWSARVVDFREGLWKVCVNSPVNAIIGYYTMSIKISSGVIENLGEFMMLFNPWCEDDPVYLHNEAERREYVLSEDGIIYLGTESHAQPQPWHFGQFEEDIPEICIWLLDTNPRYQETPEKHYIKRNDPVYICQMIGDMIGQKDDEDRVAFMCGNEILSYKWISSIPVLRQWFQKGSQTVYGQHWVFAAVLCTVLRCLGIPTRIVTNYNSAHNTEESLRKDVYYNENGARIHRSRLDSIWHFHVWNECWMERKDLFKGFGGWQVLDATAQLKYNGALYCDGPAPVRAIREGFVDLNYDTKLIYAKVVTDTVTWVRNSDGFFKKAFSSTRHVGDGMVTKSVACNLEDDLTYEYKHPKGCQEEYEAVQRAKLLMLKTEQPSEDNPMLLSPFLVSIIPQSGQLSGNYISVSVTVTNVSEEETDLELVIGAQPVHDYGITGAQFWSEKFYFHLTSGEERSVSGRIDPSLYETVLLDNNLLRVTALVKEPKDHTSSFALAEQDVTICKPNLMIQIPKVAVEFQPVTAMLTLTNPLKETLKKIVIRATGKGLLYKERIYRCNDVLPEGDLIYPLTFTPTQSGDRRLCVQMQSDKLGLITSFQNLEVLPSNVEEWSVHHWEVFKKFAESSNSAEDAESGTPISLSIHTEGVAYYGHDIPFSLEVSNKSEAQKSLYVYLTAEYVDEDGNGSIHFWQESFDVSLQAKKGHQIQTQIPLQQYAVSPVESSVVRLTGLVKDITSTYCLSRKVILHKPQIVIKMPEEAPQYKPITAVITITNPLEEELENCTVTVSGEGLIHKERSYKCDNIDPGSERSCSTIFSPTHTGLLKFRTKFSCRQFKEVTGCHCVDVQPYRKFFTKRTGKAI
ncbi:PREDICTED: erythrocyte membrane protein band 4.2-like [Nanorana parkeri]|uniref:erythrocyte membrane protein band 4.2-like n=1 Tax=Nanorana parkeri TaxID=125878 RepID=UPI000854D49C|nr:PREDICTED: erythrocyte membrane protein band 4.2-like [Nanorana parkeri]